MSNKINIVSIAFRNLARHKVKTLLTATAIMLSVWAYIIMDAWMLGAKIDSKRNLINFEMGAAKIYSKKYFENKEEMPLYYGFKNYQKIIDSLDKNGYNGLPVVTIVSSIISHETELPFIILAMDPIQEKKVLRLHTSIEEGGEFIKNKEFKIVLGVSGAKNLGVTVGDPVRLATTIDKLDPITGKINHIHQIIDLVVGGILNTTDPVPNSNYGYLPLDILQDENGLLLEGLITQIIIREKGAKEYELARKNEAPSVIANKLGKALPANLLVVSWKDDSKDFLAISGGDTASFYILITFLIVLAIIGISNTILMAILERTKEIGMIKALGMTNLQIGKLFIYEAMLIGVIGAIIGVIFGILTNIYMVKYGVDYSAFMEATVSKNIGYRVNGVFKSAWNYTTIVIAPIIAVIISGIVAIPPILRAIKISIVDALRFE